MVAEELVVVFRIASWLKVFWGYLRNVIMRPSNTNAHIEQKIWSEVGGRGRHLPGTSQDMTEYTIRPTSKRIVSRELVA
jgi:hypothetical protein